MPKTSWICSAVSIEHQLVIDGQTDTDTGPWLVPRMLPEFSLKSVHKSSTVPGLYCMRTVQSVVVSSVRAHYKYQLSLIDRREGIVL